MRVIPTELPGVILIEPKVFGDSRGQFFETYHAERYAEQGITVDFVQDNFSRSNKNVLRGLHYQLQHMQGKLVWITRGKIMDVVADIRQGSPTFGRSISVLLDATHPQQLYIPPGFAHGFCVLSDEADFFYKCSDYYNPAGECGVRWDDPTLNIQWPISHPILSDKDRAYPSLKDISAEQLPRYEQPKS